MADGDTITPERVRVLAEAAGITMPEADCAQAAEVLAGNRKGVLAKLDLIADDTAPAAVMEPRWGPRP